MPAVVIEKCDTPRSYVIRDMNGVVYRRNSKFLRHSKNSLHYLPQYADSDDESSNLSKVPNTTNTDEYEGQRNNINFDFDFKRTRSGRIY